MPLFTVAIKEQRYATAYIEADTEEEAAAKAKEAWTEDTEGDDWTTSHTSGETFKIGKRELLTCEADGCFEDE